MSTELRNVKEDSTYRVSGVFEDEAGEVIPDSDLTSLRFWLYDHLGVVINGRDDVNCLNTGIGSVDSEGNFTLTLSPEDNPIVGPNSDHFERHLLVVEWRWALDVKKSHENIYLLVRNDSKIPT